ncbi:MAG: hypothetical protein DHS20C05_05950 [Hyphococcus sp.]|nr:MAG: hypothetical protein DHS20C05_05950 [Marinicaulis sp.]
MRGTVILFVKAPRAGKVKTRLGAEIGMGRAAALFRIMTTHTIGELVKGDWQTMLAVDPTHALTGWDNLWPPNLKRVAQGGGDLGARMGRVIDQAPPGPVVIIGADAPGLRTDHLRQAFQKLGGHDAVFGPAEDGGYWLIGLARRRSAPDLFHSVRWSTQHALDDTKASLPKDFSIAELMAMQDIDEANDLAVWGPRSTVL